MVSLVTQGLPSSFPRLASCCVSSLFIVIGLYDYNLFLSSYKGIQITENGKVLLVESGVREFWLAESGTLSFKTPNTA